MKVYDLVARIGDAIFESLPEPKPSKSFINPGADVPWDECCNTAGQFWIKLAGFSPKEGNRPSIDPSCRIVGWDLELEVGQIQCVAAVNENGAPSGDQMTEDAHRLLDDMENLLKAIKCLVPEVPGVLRMDMGSWRPQGPTGGCAGGVWTFSVTMDDCWGC